MTPKLTIGLPTYDDYSGAYFTIQAIRLYHRVDDVEILLVDNKPDSPASEHLRGLIAAAGPLARYLAAPDIVGPAGVKDRAVREARAPHALIMDAHCLLPANAIARLIDYNAKNETSNDLLTGPLISDNLKGLSTHFADVWRGEMHGIWASAWQAPDGQTLSVLEGPHGAAKFVTLEMNHRELTGPLYPEIPHFGHERALVRLGFKPLGNSADDVFEIPGQGCGLFAVRTATWAGFNHNFRGFGGEELYIHEKYRRRGDKVLCLGFLKWLHRFGHVEGVKYRNERYDRVRNYVLGHTELGWSLDPVYENFVKNGSLTQGEWDYLIANPVERILAPQAQAEANRAAEAAQPLTLDRFYEAAKAQPYDLDQHMDKLRELAAKVDSVTDISDRDKSLIAFAAAQPKRLTSFNAAANTGPCRTAKALFPAMQLQPLDNSVDQPQPIEPTDLLFIDTRHSGRQFAADLEYYAPLVSRFIVRHDTTVYGSKSPDGSEGLAAVTKRFLETHPDWFIAYHTDAQHGLTVLGHQEQDRPPYPIVIWSPGFGPGTELKAILRSMGVFPAPGCSCNRRALQMDMRGVEGCKATRDEIVGWISREAAAWGWLPGLKTATEEWIDPAANLALTAEEQLAERMLAQQIAEAEPENHDEQARPGLLSVAWKAIKSGVAFKLSATDPCGSLVDLAIKRAEKTQGE